MPAGLVVALPTAALVGVAAMAITAARGRSRAAAVLARVDTPAAPRRPPSAMWLGAGPGPGPPGARRGWMATRLQAADLPLDDDLLWRAWPGLAVAGAAAGMLTGGAGLAVLGAASGALCLPLALIAADGRAERRTEAAMPEALEAIARSLRSGASLRQAVDEAAGTAPAALARALQRVRADLLAGVPLVDALDGWADRQPLPGVRLAVGALALGAEAGGARAQAIDGVAATLRSRLAITAEVRSLAAQARLSALVIAVAPLVFAIFAASADGRATTFLLGTPLGQVCLAAGLGLDVAGALWMQRLCRIEP